MLDQPIFERVVGEHHQPTAGPQQVGGLAEQLAQGAHFVVDGNAQGLKHLGQVAIFAAPGGQGQGNGPQVGDGVQRPGAVEGRGQGAGIAHLAVLSQQAVERGFVRCIEQVGGRRVGLGVHPHIERAVEARRKAPFGGVDLEGRNAQVGQQPVNGRYAVKAQVAPQVAKVGRHEGEAIAGKVGGVGVRVGVLVEPVEASGREPIYDGPGVPAAAEGDIHVGALGPER